MNKLFRTLISPILVICLMAVFYLLNGIYPFGSKDIAWCDMQQQVIPILMQFKDVLSGNSGMFYSTVNAGGMNFWGVFLFFISSPFTFLVAIIDKTDMMNFMNILVVLKMAVCAFTSGIYFKSEIKSLHLGFNVLLSVMYAFCGYSLMYYQNVVWLDAMYLFPLLLIAHKRMLVKNKPLFYIAALTAFVAVHFYLTYMVALFIIIETYFFIKMNISERKKSSTIILFVVSSFTALLLSAVFWLPSFMQYLDSGRDGSIILNLQQDDFFSHMPDKLEFIICSAALFICIPVFTCSKWRNSINTRVKQLAVTLIFLVIPLIIEPVNKMWHTGSYQCYPLRYGYMTILIGLTVFGYILSENYTIDIKLKSKKILAKIAVAAVCIYAVYAVYGCIHITNKLKSYVSTLWTNNEQVTVHFEFFSAALVTYTLCFIAYKSNTFHKYTIILLMSIVCIGEVFVNTSIFIGNASSNDSLFNITMKLDGAIKDKGFYRVKVDKKYIHANMLGALGYNSLAHYTSLIPRDYIFAIKKLGYSSYWMEVSSNGGTRITDAILSNKYTIGSKSYFQSYAKEVYADNVFNIYENDLCLPAGIVTSSDIKDLKNIDFTDRISVQKTLSEELLGSNDIIKEYNISGINDLDYDYLNGEHTVKIKNTLKPDPEITYNIYVSGTQEIYFDLFDNISTQISEEQYKSASVYVNGILMAEEYPTQMNNGILKLGTFTNENISVKIKVRKDFYAKSFGVFGIDLDKLSDIIENVDSVNIIHNGNNFYTNCNGTDGEYLYLSVPYNKGFYVTNNGEKSDVIKVNDCFMAVKLTNGENKINFSFCPPGFILSAFLSLSGVLLVVLLFIFRKKYLFLFNNLNKYSKIADVSLEILFLCVIVVIYIFPVIVSLAGML